MKKFTLIFYFVSALTVCQAQNYFFTNFNFQSLNSFRLNPNTVNFTNTNGLELNGQLEWLKDRKKFRKSQHGLIFNMSALTIMQQAESNLRFGLYYSNNVGFNYSEQTEYKVGFTSYAGPYWRLRLNPENSGVPFDTFIGLSVGVGLQFKLFNQSRAKFLFINEVDNNAFSDFNPEGRFNYGFAFSFSAPLNKINGISRKERKNLYKKEGYRKEK